MERELTREVLKKIQQAAQLSDISYQQLVELVQKEPGLSDFKPDGTCQIDPRTGDRILFNTARAKRPHDNKPGEKKEAAPEKPCYICQGKTTGVIDVRDLSKGFTFINKNLFPMLYPEKKAQAQGFHLLQWTSSFHETDFHNMSLEDCVIVMEQLSKLEKKLLSESNSSMPSNQEWGGSRDLHGFVSVIKNYGHLVGGSLAHGHQQVGFSNVMPNRFYKNMEFEKERGEKFSSYLLRENPKELTVKDYGEVSLVVPYFMRRPFDMILVIKDSSKRYLHELNEKEIQAMAQGWHDGIYAMLEVMPRIGRESAYNITLHNGPGAGLYTEFLPYTQETGGFEHLGLYVCQGNPAAAAESLRDILK